MIEQQIPLTMRMMMMMMMPWLSVLKHPVKQSLHRNRAQAQILHKVRICVLVPHSAIGRSALGLQKVCEHDCKG